MLAVRGHDANWLLTRVLAYTDTSDSATQNHST